MKSIIILLAVFSIGITSTSAQEAKKFTETVKMEVNGLSCPFCAYGLEKNLKEIPAIEKITINVKDAFVTLVLKKGESVLEEDLKKKVKDAGFTVGDIKQVGNE